jgi:hypothetical protein
MSMQFNSTVRNAMVDAITTGAGSNAKIQIYSGSKPATCATGLSGNTKLAELACSSTFAPAASGGVLTVNAISNDAAADATGTATFFRVVTSAGNGDTTGVVAQGDVGTSGADLNLNTTSIVANGIVSITSCTFTAPGA